MKTLFLFIALLISGAHAFSQNERFVKGMEKTIALLDSAKSSDEFTSVAAAFERIGDAEKTQWLPYYYAALANIWKGFTDTKINKDDVATRAESLITKAEALEPNNSEIALLKNMTSTLHMLVDPMNRWQQYGTQSAQALSTAKQLDPNNPRVYLMEGQSLMGTPAQFGGGKDKAKPVFEKSVTLYKTFKPASPLHPVWGESNAEKMLAAASK